MTTYPVIRPGKSPKSMFVFQDEAKKNGAPWFMAKSFDTSSPVSWLMDSSMIPASHNEEIYCINNGVEKQRGATSTPPSSSPWRKSTYC